jgi:hypothetical protein
MEPAAHRPEGEVVDVGPTAIEPRLPTIDRHAATLPENRKCKQDERYRYKTESHDASWQTKESE